MRPFSSIFERPWQLVEVPDGWRKANIIPIFGKGRKEDPGDIKPVSLTLVPRKVMGRIFLETISQHMQDTKMTGSSQLSERDRSCGSELVAQLVLAAGLGVLCPLDPL